MQPWKIVGPLALTLGIALAASVSLLWPRAPQKSNPSDFGVEGFEANDEQEVPDQPIAATSDLQDDIIDGTEPLDDETLQATADDIND